MVYILYYNPNKYSTEEISQIHDIIQEELSYNDKLIVLPEDIKLEVLKQEGSF